MARETTIDNPQQQLDDGLQRWFCASPGQILLEQEKLRTGKMLATLFGYHILQLGGLGGTQLLASSNISHKILMLLDRAKKTDVECSLLGDRESLAIASDSMDVVLLPHVLEFVANPHKLLREVERVLIGEGHLLVIGFNPWSLWGIWRLILFWREQAPWNGHFYGQTRIRDWLSLLDFELVKIERFFFRPPLKKKMFIQKLNFLETLGKHCWPFFGGAYIILAKKRVVPLTPVKMRWHARRQLIASGVIESGSPV